jgi:DNA-binding SARP family transcriptional activator
MDFRVLGPVEVWVDGRALVAARPQQTAVLAMLAVDANRLIRTETLIDRIWGDRPPERARRTLHTHISRIRRMLEQRGAPGSAPVRLLWRPGGYVLNVDAERVDLHRFHRLVAQADVASGAAERVAALRQAMALWRGEPLADVPGEWAGRVREAWRQHYLAAVAAWAQAEVEVGNPAGVIGPLTALAGEYPLAEHLVAALMRALHAAGRTADALDRYVRLRHRLVEEVGVEPGTEVRALHRAILRGEPTDRRTGTPVPVTPALCSAVAW